MKFVAFFDSDHNQKENRMYVLAATNKIRYICSAVNALGEPVEIISPSWTKNTKGFYRGKQYALNELIQVHLFSTFGAANRLTRGLKYFWSLLSLTLYLIFHVQRGETVMAYHSQALCTPLRIVKRLKRIRLVVEIEEIYANIRPDKHYDQVERRFFSLPDAFIFPTELLNEQLNQAERPYAVTYGTYQVEPDRESKREDSKIHAVYAGTFDPKKGGAMAAIAAAAFLPGDYHMHIIGFGTDNERQDLLDRNSEVARTTECTITYDGCLSGEEYIRFLQSCDIGLSTQTPEGAYNKTSFPSKVLSYLANGLRVVSIRIEVLERCTVGDLLVFYDEDTPEAIAEAIQRVDLNKPYDSRGRIEELNRKFIEDLKVLLER